MNNNYMITCKDFREIAPRLLSLKERYLDQPNIPVEISVECGKMMIETMSFLFNVPISMAEILTAETYQKIINTENLNELCKENL